MHWERSAFAVLTAAAAIGLISIRLPGWILYEVWMYWNHILLSSEQGGQIEAYMWFRLLLARVLIPELILLILVKRRSKAVLQLLFLLDLQASSLLSALSFGAAGFHRIYRILLSHMIYNVVYLSAVCFCIWLCEYCYTGEKTFQKRILPYLTGIMLLAGLVMESVLLI